MLNFQNTDPVTQTKHETHSSAKIRACASCDVIFPAFLHTSGHNYT